MKNSLKCFFTDSGSHSFLNGGLSCYCEMYKILTVSDQDDVYKDTIYYALCLKGTNAICKQTKSKTLLLQYLNKC